MVKLHAVRILTGIYQCCHYLDCASKSRICVYLLDSIFGMLGSLEILSKDRGSADTSVIKSTDYYESAGMRLSRE